MKKEDVLMKLSVIIPAYNEYVNLKKNFNKIYNHLKKLKRFELIVAEDGSTDGSKELLSAFAKLKNVKVISRERRLGKGGALKEAIAIAQGDVIGYIDADLSTPLTHVDEAVSKVLEGNKVVFGSRYEEGSDADRTIIRFVASRTYNLIIKALFNSHVSDHQCGFKFWDGKYIKKEIRHINDNSWFFDSEMLIRAQREGVAIYALPIGWAEGSKTRIRIRDVLDFIRSIIGLRLSGLE
jgi:hypothetical protein